MKCFFRFLPNLAWTHSSLLTREGKSTHWPFDKAPFDKGMTPASAMLPPLLSREKCQVFLSKTWGPFVKDLGIYIIEELVNCFLKRCIATLLVYVVACVAI